MFIIICWKLDFVSVSLYTFLKQEKCRMAWRKIFSCLEFFLRFLASFCRFFFFFFFLDSSFSFQYYVPCCKGNRCLFSFCKSFDIYGVIEKRITLYLLVGDRVYLFYKQNSENLFSEYKLFGEFDPGSGWMLAVRLIHASRGIWSNPGTGKRVRNTLESALKWGITTRNRG